jgi:hypothetical protein
LLETPIKNPFKWKLFGFISTAVIYSLTTRRWENNIKMDLREVGWGLWTGLIWLRIGSSGVLL